MLGREEQRRLRELERDLAGTDPEFARRMRAWTSPVPFAQRRWPLGALLVASLLVVWLGALTVSMFWTFAGVFGVVFALTSYGRQVRRRGKW